MAAQGPYWVLRLNPSGHMQVQVPLSSPLLSTFITSLLLPLGVSGLSLFQSGLDAFLFLE